MVARDEELDRSAALPEHLLERLAVELELARLSPVGRVAQMHEGVDPARFEMLEGLQDVSVREIPVRRFAVPPRHEVRVAQHAEHEVRLCLRRLPSGGRREERQSVRRPEHQ